ncbi:hypothetical protein PO250_02025 [Limosilactobacillus mucosae]|uniref:Uncharacterized protein n=1 Tax=Limosilactobacillus mucosae TaxID=97478 RepID=A0AAJ1HR60_LIMMU|nr:hypothetical protein [Limosilactobacillus mucosae]MDC2829114.1 hypothetical protein [Limosilactobacillus mucosae]
MKINKYKNVLLTNKNISQVRLAVHDLLKIVRGEDLAVLATIGQSLINRLANGQQFLIENIQADYKIKYDGAIYKFSYNSQAEIVNDTAIFLLRMVNASHLEESIDSKEKLEKLIKPYRVI